MLGLITRSIFMNQSEIHLATAILQYLRTATQHRSVHKFNVIGRSGKGDFELSTGRELTSAERQALIWIWDELKRLRLISATGTDLVNPDSWVVISERGLTLSDSDLEQMLQDGTGPKRPEKRTDGLLGIPDRGEFDRDFSKSCEQANADNPLSLIMIDLDHFKSINDDFGHPVGDQVLREAASAASGVVNGKGEIYRYGGEEFGVLLQNHSLAEAGAVAERIRSAIESIDISSVDRCITASLGVATLPEVTPDAKRLVEDADDALYRSKQNGRNRVTCTDKPTLEPVAQKKLRPRAPATTAKVNVRVQLEQACRECYLIKIENNSDSELVVEQISIEQNGIALMEPSRAKAGDNWTVRPRSRHEISWKPQPNPGDSLVRLNSNEGIQFNSTIEIVLLLIQPSLQLPQRWLNDPASTQRHKCQGMTSVVPLKVQKNNFLAPQARRAAKRSAQKLLLRFALFALIRG